MTRELFDKAAADWDKKPLRLQLAEKVVEAISKAVPLSRTMNAVEIGGGTGLITISLCQKLSRIVACDTSSGMLDVLKEKIVDLGVENIEPILTDLNEPNSALSHGQFQLIYSSMTLHHIRDTAALLGICHRLLAPGGYLAFADLEQEDGSFHSDMGGVEHLGFAPQALGELAKERGFTDISCTTAHVITKEDAEGNERFYPVFLLTARKT